ncbi:hypothetical protein GCM10010327_61610 [Streptomyces nitrosporeus]|nr:hypothetical protein GCM10010327_61610 [Streptomyces nitrosporeus]
MVIAAVAEQDVGPSTGSSHESRDRRDLGEQGHQLGNIIAVSASQGHRERDALSVDEDVLATRPCAIDRAGTASGPRRAARTREESINARDRSSCFAARNRASSTTCSPSQTPASFQAASRRRHVMPEPKPSSCGRYSHRVPVCGTNRIPRNTRRSGTLGRPGTIFDAGTGNNGSTSDHSSSETIHGRDSLFPTNSPTSIQADSHII